MSSFSLMAIVRNWEGEFPKQGVTTLPFNLEEACREIDDQLDTMKKDLDGVTDYMLTHSKGDGGKMWAKELRQKWKLDEAEGSRGH